MSGDCMRFPDTVEEFMEQYKVVDKEGIYMSKGAKLVPIFRMEQWFEHEKAQLSQEGTTKDAISRQEALDAFGLSEKTRKYGGDHSGYNTMMLYEIQGILEGLPSAQPEIIRCKDCKHKGTKNCVANAWTTIFGFGVKDDFYCGLAERRTDERHN